MLSEQTKVLNLMDEGTQYANVALIRWLEGPICLAPLFFPDWTFL